MKKKMDKKDEVVMVETKDQWEIIALIVMGHTPVKIFQREKSEGKREIYYRFSGVEAQKDYVDYTLGIRREPLSMLRIFKEAHTHFKENLYKQHPIEQ